MLFDAHTFAVERRINHRLRDVQRGLADRTPLAPAGMFDPDADGFLFIVEPLHPVRPRNSRQLFPTWCATAHLLTARRRLVARVELEVSMWSSDASCVTLRPIARHPERWRARRVRQYFALAHDAVDETARLIAQRASNAIVATQPESIGNAIERAEVALSSR